VDVCNTLWKLSHECTCNCSNADIGRSAQRLTWLRRSYYKAQRVVNWRQAGSGSCDYCQLILCISCTSSRSCEISPSVPGPGFEYYGRGCHAQSLLACPNHVSNTCPEQSLLSTIILLMKHRAVSAFSPSEHVTNLCYTIIRRETVGTPLESSSEDTEHVASKKVRALADQPPPLGNFNASVTSLISCDTMAPKDFKSTEVCALPAGSIVGSECIQSIL
jgi:hypothetical protein